MLTERFFVKIAEWIGSISDFENRYLLTNSAVEWLKSENPRFNEEKFRKAVEDAQR
jgi:hypothetical protein